MALQFRRGTAADVASESFVPVLGEPVWITDENKLYIGDGVTQKGQSVAGASDLKDLTSVDLITEYPTTIQSYSITSNVVTINLTTSHGGNYAQYNSVTISGSDATILNGTHEITSTPTNSQFTFALTNADVTNTAATGTVQPNIKPGSILKYSGNLNAWIESDAERLYFSNGIFSNPQTLEYNLDVDGNDIISSSTNDINLTPADGRDVVIKGNATGGSGKIVLNCEQNTHGVKIQGPPHSAAANYTLTLPNTVGTNGQVLQTNGSGGLSFATTGVINQHVTFDFTATTPTATVPNSSDLGQNYGGWVQLDETQAAGPSTVDYNPTLLGITFDPVNGYFNNIPEGRYHLFVEMAVVIDNVTPGFGSNLLHALIATDTANTWTYSSNLHELTPLPYTSYGSAAHTFTIPLNMSFVAEEPIATDNRVSISLDQNMSTSYYVKSAKANFIKVGDA